MMRGIGAQDGTDLGTGITHGGLGHGDLEADLGLVLGLITSVGAGTEDLETGGPLTEGSIMDSLMDTDMDLGMVLMPAIHQIGGTSVMESAIEIMSEM